jgi:hypothetical protein
MSSLGLSVPFRTMGTHTKIRMKQHLHRKKHVGWSNYVDAESGERLLGNIIKKKKNLN